MRACAVICLLLGCLFSAPHALSQTRGLASEQVWLVAQQDAGQRVLFEIEAADGSDGDVWVEVLVAWKRTQQVPAKAAEESRVDYVRFRSVVECSQAEPRLRTPEESFNYLLSSERAFRKYTHAMLFAVMDDANPALDLKSKAFGTLAARACGKIPPRKISLPADVPTLVRAWRAS